MSGEQKHSTRVETALKNPANQIWLSLVSIWGLMTLVQKNRVKLDAELDRRVEQSWEILPVKEAPLTWKLARDRFLSAIRLPHAEPHYPKKSENISRLALVPT